MRVKLRLNVNGEKVVVESSPTETLLDMLRDTLRFTGPKKGCDETACGACSVLLDGKAVCSCTVLAPEAEGRRVVTIEGLSHDGKLSSLQQAFVELDALQCSFCTPGQVIAAESFLRSFKGIGPPSSEMIKEAMSGNLCRCGCYNRIVEAVAWEAKKRTS